jgi:8-oxo-dGTP diphosphatase
MTIASDDVRGGCAGNGNESESARPGPEPGRAPEVLARGLIRNKQGKVLLVRHRARNWWFAPGGHLEWGETTSEALRRELIEEAELPITVRGLLAVGEHAYEEDAEHRVELNLLLEADTDASIGTVEEHLEFQWFDSGALDDVEIRPRMIADVMRGTVAPATAVTVSLHDLA